MKFSIQSIALIIIALTVISSCQSNEKALLGVWRLESFSENDKLVEACAPGEEPYYIEFNDGGILNHSYSSESGTYKVTGNELYIATGGEDHTWNFSVDGDVLTLNGNSTDGKKITQTYLREVDYKFE